MRSYKFTVSFANYALSGADILRRILSSTSLSSSCACCFNTGVMERDWYPGRFSHRSTSLRIRLTQSSAWAFVASAGNCRNIGTVVLSIVDLRLGPRTIPRAVLHANRFESVGTIAGGGA